MFYMVAYLYHLLSDNYVELSDNYINLSDFLELSFLFSENTKHLKIQNTIPVSRMLTCQNIISTF